MELVVVVAGWLLWDLCGEARRLVEVISASQHDGVSVRNLHQFRARRASAAAAATATAAAAEAASDTSGASQIREGPPPSAYQADGRAPARQYLRAPKCYKMNATRT